MCQLCSNENSTDSVETSPSPDSVLVHGQNRQLLKMEAWEVQQKPYKSHGLQEWESLSLGRVSAAPRGSSPSSSSSAPSFGGSWCCQLSPASSEQCSQPGSKRSVLATLLRRSAMFSSHLDPREVVSLCLCNRDALIPAELLFWCGRGSGWKPEMVANPCF